MSVVGIFKVRAVDYKLYYDEHGDDMSSHFKICKSHEKIYLQHYNSRFADFNNFDIKRK